MLLTLRKYKRIPYENIFVYLPIFLFSLYMAIDGFIVSTVKEFMVVAYCPLFYIFGDIILYQIDKTEFKKVIKSYFIFNLFLMLADLIYRIFNSSNFFNENQYLIGSIYAFYAFKDTSLLHEDSNGSGVIILSIVSVLAFINTNCAKKDKFFKKLYFVFFILLLLTFARASIVSFIVLFLFIHFFFKRHIYFKTILVAIGCFLVPVLFTFLTTIGNINDGSYSSKIMLFIKTYNYLKWADMFQFIFGNGDAIARIILHGSAHNFVTALLVISGFISLLLYVWMFIAMAVDAKKGSYMIILPYFITSLSYTPLATPYIFVALLIVKHMNKKEIVNE